MPKLLPTVRYLVARGAEPSSYAGAAAILAVLGYHVDPGLVQAAIGAASACCSLAAVLLRDRGAAQ